MFFELIVNIPWVKYKDSKSLGEYKNMGIHNIQQDVKYWMYIIRIP